MKHMVKLMVTSATYRQVGAADAEGGAEQATRRTALLARARVSGWTRRWSATTPSRVSGLLVEKIGGASVQAVHAGRGLGGRGHAQQQYPATTSTRPRRQPLSPQPLHLLETDRSARRPWRSLQRPHPRGSCTVRRERTNTPLPGAPVTAQRPPIRRGRPRAWPQNALQGGVHDATDGRIEFIATPPDRPRPLAGRRDGRSCQANRWRSWPRFYKEHPDDAKKLVNFGDSKADASLDPTELAAWTMLCNELMNLDEVALSNRNPVGPEHASPTP